MRIGNLKLRGKVLLAPLAGVSNRPFRVLAAKGGAAMTYTEMVSSEAIIREQDKTFEMMHFKPDEQPLGIQLFGSNPEVLGRAARITAERFKPDLIDLNFGCPVKKVVNKNGGAAVLKDLKLTEDIVSAVVQGAGEIPVTIKMRIGWDDTCPVYREVGQIAQKTGARAVTLHARSRSKGFSGDANWDTIRELKESAPELTIIGNGDVLTPQDAERMLNETGCDGVMIGRAALGNPFVFKQMNTYLESGEILGEPSIVEKIEMARLHAQLMAEQFGEERGAVMTRRYLGWYVKGFPGASELRPLLFSVHTVKDIDNIFAGYLQGTLRVDPASLGSERPAVSAE